MSTAMNAWEHHQHLRQSGQISRARSFDRLNRLPKFCIANLYRELVCAPRDEDKCDMVSTLWRRYGYDTRLWSLIPAEEDYAARVKEAKKAGQPKPTF